MRTLRRYLRRTAKFFVSFQVELRGHYSVNRMRNFDDYHRTSSTFRALFLCFILPFPCLIVLSMVDAAPLAPPSSSSRDNYMFWIRDCILVVLLTRAIIEQISINVPGLHMTSMQRLVLSVAATLVATAYRMVCSRLIGFPLPFQLVLASRCGSPPCHLLRGVLWVNSEARSCAVMGVDHGYRGAQLPDSADICLSD